MVPQSTNDREHRRGLVLGLTLAEIMLLLLFLVMLGLGNLLADRLKENESLREEKNAAEQKTKDLERLTKLSPTEREKLLARIEKIDQLEDEAKRLAGLVSNLQSQLTEAQNKSEAAEKAIREFRSVIEIARRINPEDPPAALRRGLELLDVVGSTTMPDQLKDRAQLSAENEELKKRLADAGTDRDKFRRERDHLMQRAGGRGMDWPACWIAENNKAEFIFDVTILDSGYLVRDAAPAGRASDPAWKSVGQFQRNVPITREEFRAALGPLYNWSVANECRFYVYLRDRTGPTNKPTYIRLRTEVEGFFYVALRN